MAICPLPCFVGAAGLFIESQQKKSKTVAMGFNRKIMGKVFTPADESREPLSLTLHKHIVMKYQQTRNIHAIISDGTEIELKVPKPEQILDFTELSFTGETDGDDAVIEANVCFPTESVIESNAGIVPEDIVLAFRMLIAADINKITD